MDLTRQLDILHPQLVENEHITLIGSGGIGAATALALAKMGIGHLDLYDPDKVEDVNIATQMLGKNDIGKAKVLSVAGLLGILADAHGTARPQRVTANTELPPNYITVSGLDSITARKEVWRAVKNAVGDTPSYYLDARMGAEVFQLYTVSMTDYQWYENHLDTLDEDSVPDLPCTAKATIYTAFIAAGLIAAQVKRILAADPSPRMIVFDIEMMDLLMPMGGVVPQEIPA